MPNWIKNKVYVGNGLALKECMSKDEDGNEYFDFNKIIEMPKELEQTTAPSRKPNKELIKKYGVDNWYDWRVENWGTKWNSCDNEIIDGQHIVFRTAWSMPNEVFIALSKKYHTRIIVEYADEDLGYNCGTRKYNNGKIVEDSTGNLAFAKKIWRS